MRNVLCVSACPGSLPKIIFLLQGQLKISTASQFFLYFFVLHDDATQRQQRRERWWRMFFVFLCCSHGFLVGFLQGQLKISAASQFWVEFVLHDDATQHQQRGNAW